MRNKNSMGPFILIVLVAPFAANGLMTWYEGSVSLPVVKEKSNGSVKREHHITDFHLLNQDGNLRTLADWKDKIVVVDFFFTHCPVICPKITASMKRVQQEYSTDSSIRFASITVDPERDSSMQLKKHIRRFDLDEHNWDLLTGDKKEIYRLARNSFMVVATDGDGGPADFIHSDKLVLIDTKQRIRGYYDGTDEKEANKLLKDIKKLKNEN
jgi:protein SCO1